MPITQSPFEKSIARRISKARKMVELIKANGSYSSRSEPESIEGLELSIGLFEEKSIGYFELVEKYTAVSMLRKSLFQGQRLSLREVSLKMKHDLSESSAVGPDQLEQLKSLHAAIISQNPIPPPSDFSNPSFDQQLHHFMSSYQVLVKSFKALVEIAEACHYEPDDPDYSTPRARAIIHRAAQLTVEINKLIQDLYGVRDERLEIFLALRERSRAITNRCRYLFGPQDSTYKMVYRLRLAIV